MDAAQTAYLSTLALLIIIGEGMWICRLTKKYHRLMGALSRASAKVAQHKILVTEPRELVEDDEDLDRCLQEEVDAKFAETARDIRYEQNKASGRDEIPWIPKE